MVLSRGTYIGRSSPKEVSLMLDKRATCGTLKRSMGMNAFFDTNVVLHALLGREL